MSETSEMTRRREPLAFVTRAVIGTLGGLIGLGGAEFRLPLLISQFRFSGLEAVTNEFNSDRRLLSLDGESPDHQFLYFFTTTISGLSLAALLCTTSAFPVAPVFSLRAR